MSTPEQKADAQKLLDMYKGVYKLELNSNGIATPEQERIRMLHDSSRGKEYDDMTEAEQDAADKKEFKAGDTYNPEPVTARGGARDGLTL